MKVFLYACLLLPLFAWANIDEENCIKVSAHSDYADEGQSVSWGDIDINTAKVLCSKAINSQDYRVFYGLGRAWAKQYEVTLSETDSIQAIAAFEKSFNLGYANGAWAIAYQYIQRKSWSTAVQWLDKGIKNNSAHALNLMALLLFDKSYGYPHRDIDKAIALYNMFDEANNGRNEIDSFIYYNLGRIYYYETYQRQNYSLAMKYLSKAGNIGNSDAENLVAYMYQQGLGVPKNAKKAADHYTRAKTLGYESKTIDQNIIQNAWNVWLNDREAFDYYDIAINTLRELAKKENKDAIKFLYAQKIGISSKESPLDTAIVSLQSKTYIERAIKAGVESHKDVTKEDIKKTRDSIKKYADLMIDNGLYSDVIDFFEGTSTVRYRVTGQLNEYYLAMIYLNLYRDFKHEDDAVKAIANVRKLGDAKILTTVISALKVVDNDNLDIDTLLAKSSQVNKDKDTETFFNSFNTTLEVGASERAIAYVNSAAIDINSQRALDGASMLHLSVWFGDLAVTKVLIDKGADINLKDKEGDTPLAYAIHIKDIDLITYLSAKGAKN